MKKQPDKITAYYYLIVAYKENFQVIIYLAG